MSVPIDFAFDRIRATYRCDSSSRAGPARLSRLRENPSMFRRGARRSCETL